jgi:hypothetical protein
VTKITEKILVALISALAGGMLTYATKAIAIEGRLDGIERAVIRIEAKIK